MRIGPGLDRVDGVEERVGGVGCLGAIWRRAIGRADGRERRWGGGRSGRQRKVDSWQLTAGGGLPDWCRGRRDKQGRDNECCYSALEGTPETRRTLLAHGGAPSQAGGGRAWSRRRRRVSSLGGNWHRR